MTHTTPERALPKADFSLRSLANQVEAVILERDYAVQSAKYTADLCTQALADLEVMTAERDALKLKADAYDFIRAGNVHIEPDVHEIYAAIGKGHGKYYKDMRDFDADISDAAIAKEAK